MSYTLSQTFFVDPNSVANSAAVYLTDITLYFLNVATYDNNQSGVINPAVTLSISPTKSSAQSGSVNIPDINKTYNGSYVTVRQSNILADSAAASIPTKFTFPTPVLVNTGSFYSININLSDSGFVLANAKTGDDILGSGVVAAVSNTSGSYTITTYQKFPGFVGGNQGQLFDTSTDGTVTPRQATQLKFSVNVVKFLTNSIAATLTNKNYEFFSTNNQNVVFLGGESVYAIGANSIGTVTFTTGSTDVTGTGTAFLSSFTSGGNSYVAMYDTSTHITLRKVLTVSNNTFLTVTEPLAYSNSTGSNFFKTPIGKIYAQSQTANTLYLVDSTANSALFFQANQSLVGATSNATALILSVDSIGVSSMEPEFGINLPPASNAAINFAFAEANATTYALHGSYESADNYKLRDVTDYNPIIMSRSLEVLYPTYLYQANKSAVFNVTLTESNTGSGIFSSPSLYKENLDVFTYSNYINNVDLNENTNNGGAYAKHITTKLTFDQGSAAEDLIVYATIFKPAGTSVEAYAKLFNSNDPDSFYNKEWTPMLITNNSDNFISTVAANNYGQLSFGLPTSPTSLVTVAGSVTTQMGNNVIVGSNTQFDNQFSNGEVIKIYSPLFNANYQVAVITAISNNDYMTIDVPISNSSVVGVGLSIDKVSDPQTAFLNAQNGNIVRYYNQETVQFDTFDTVQMKFVLLSDDRNIVPRINNIRVIGVSA